MALVEDEHATEVLAKPVDELLQPRSFSEGRWRCRRRGCSVRTGASTLLLPFARKASGQHRVCVEHAAALGILALQWRFDRDAVALKVVQGDDIIVECSDIHEVPPRVESKVGGSGEPHRLGIAT